MTVPGGSIKAITPWYARPAVILSLLGISVLLTALLVKTPTTGRDGDPRLTTRSTDPLGAKLFYELAGRMGYTTLRTSDATFPKGEQTILAVLDPVLDLNPLEVHDMLEHVRAGGALLAVLGDGTTSLSDSLRVSIEKLGATVTRAMGSARQCSTGTVFTRNGLWLGPASLYALKIPDSISAEMRSFVYVDAFLVKKSSVTAPRPAMVGIAYGVGRMVIASDPDVLRNDALRNCGYGLDVAVADALRYLTFGGPSERRTLVFDEFHQRGAARSGMTRLIREYLIETRSGRTLLQICLAGLVLLIAAIPRVLPPREDQRLARRSPLEHVDALARVYAQVGATRTGALRLVRGLQRRLSGSTKRAISTRNDDEFLARVAESKPTLAADVATIRHALNNSVSQTQFIDVGNAINRVEAALTRT